MVAERTVFPRVALAIADAKQEMSMEHVGIYQKIEGGEVQGSETERIEEMKEEFREEVYAELEKLAREGLSEEVAVEEAMVMTGLFDEVSSETELMHIGKWVQGLAKRAKAKVHNSGTGRASLARQSG